MSVKNMVKGALARCFGLAVGLGTGLTLGFTGYATFDSYKDSLNATGNTTIDKPLMALFAIAVAVPVGIWLSKKAGRIAESSLREWLFRPAPEAPKPPAPKA